jgi:hypothetical protein
MAISRREAIIRDIYPPVIDGSLAFEPRARRVALFYCIRRDINMGGVNVIYMGDASLSYGVPLAGGGTGVFTHALFEALGPAVTVS